MQVSYSINMYKIELYFFHTKVRTQPETNLEDKEVNDINL